MERRLLSRCSLLAVLMCFGAGPGTRVAADSPALEKLKQMVAAAHSYPAENLVIRENDNRVALHRDIVDVPLHAAVTSTDDSFYRFEIGAGAMNDILPESERNSFEANIAAGGAASTGKKSPLRITPMPNGAVVYSGWGMPGSDGSVALMWVLFPARDAGVVMSWTASREKPADLTKAPQHYRELISDQFPRADAISALSVLAQQTVDLALEIKTRAKIGEAPTSGDVVGEGKPPSPGHVSASGGPTFSEFPALWPWLSAGLILLVLFIVAMKQRKRL